MNNDFLITSYNKHIDNAGEIISAEHINEIWRTINKTEENCSSMNDSSFVYYCMNSLENNPYVNSMFVDIFDSPKYILTGSANNCKVDTINSCITLITPGFGEIKSSI